jgi:hypothetical protein
MLVSRCLRRRRRGCSDQLGDPRRPLAAHQRVEIAGVLAEGTRYERLTPLGVAVPDDHDLYLAGFAHDRRQLLPLLLAHVTNLREIAEQALAAPVSSGDAESARLLLDAGADPRRYRDDDGRPTSIVWAAVRAGCHTAFLKLLLTHQAGPNTAGPDGRTSYQLAAQPAEPTSPSYCARAAPPTTRAESTGSSPPAAAPTAPTAPKHSSCSTTSPDSSAG